MVVNFNSLAEELPMIDSGKGKKGVGKKETRGPQQDSARQLREKAEQQRIQRSNFVPGPQLRQKQLIGKKVLRDKSAEGEIKERGIPE